MAFLGLREELSLLTGQPPFRNATECDVRHFTVDICGLCKNNSRFCVSAVSILSVFKRTFCLIIREDSYGNLKKHIDHYCSIEEGEEGND